MAIKLPRNYCPSDTEPYMNGKQLEYFRRILLSWRNELLQESGLTVENLHENQLQSADFADRASAETDQTVELHTRDRARKLVHKIEGALERIKDGTYGFCEETGAPIGLRRLEARPVATLCVEAQERHERMEKGLISR